MNQKLSTTARQWTLTLNLLRIHFNIIFPYTNRYFSALFSASILFAVILVIRSNLGYRDQIDTSLFTTIFNTQHTWRHGHHTKHLQTKQLIPKRSRVEEWHNSSTLYVFMAGKGANLPWFSFILNTYVSVLSKTYSVACAVWCKLLLLRIITLLLNISEKVSNQNWIHEKLTAV